MRLPVIRGVIERRILVNFRVEPEILSRRIPAPLRPQIVNEYSVAGICLIRLGQIRPRYFPSIMGLSSENAAHRMAVAWDVDGQEQTGVFIPRRDTSSLLNVAAGGRIFPGTHHQARFSVREDGTTFDVAMDSLDGSTHIAVKGSLATELPSDSIFGTVRDASRFFERGAIGYSPRDSEGRLDGLELRSFSWHVEPLAVESVKSSYFSDLKVFPKGSVAFDSALVMRGIEHEWHERESIHCGAGS
jgi:Uncharacterized conserved protein (COG2071)